MDLNKPLALVKMQIGIENVLSEPLGIREGVKACGSQGWVVFLLFLNRLSLYGLKSTLICHLSVSPALS